MYIVTYKVTIFFINTSLASVLAILQLFNLLTFSTIFAAKQYSCMVFCDISKAFDIQGASVQITTNGIKGRSLACVSNYLSEKKQRVQINSATSSSLSVNAGVPQGSVLGPLLFLVYMNDIAENLLSIVRLFADDSFLFFFCNKPRLYRRHY